MTAGELQQLLEGAIERPDLEFKGACNWHAPSIAKDILAMSNVLGGGTIVFGIEDATLEKVGLSESQLRTFNPEQMQDQIANYADPHVSFRVDKLCLEDDTRFVVISISEFELTPTICRRDADELQQGCVYFRTNSGRPQSVQIRNHHDMRDIIERSAVKMQRRHRQIGLQPGADSNYESFLDKEIGGL